MNGATAECNSSPNTNGEKFAPAADSASGPHKVRPDEESETVGLGRSRRRFLARAEVKSFGCHVFWLMQEYGRVRAHRTTSLLGPLRKSVDCTLHNGTPGRQPSCQNMASRRLKVTG